MESVANALAYTPTVTEPSRATFFRISLLGSDTTATPYLEISL
ncbi:TPA: hypothetical protein ACPPBE_000592 [Haemophilus influenzae]